MNDALQLFYKSDLCVAPEDAEDLVDDPKKPEEELIKELGMEQQGMPPRIKQSQ